MPLPPAPTRRGSQLSAGDFSAKTNAKSHASAATARDEQDDDVLDLDTAPVAVAASPAPRRATAAAAPKASSRSKKVAAAPTPVQAPAPVATSAKAPSAAKPIQPARSPAVAEASPVVASKPAKAAKPRSDKAKLFVLDTNVLLHDPSSLFRFEEHDIYLPMIVLEELDGHKKGMTEVARNGRQASRTLDALVASQEAHLAQGIRLDATGQKGASGCLFFQTEPLHYQLPESLPQGKADNQILGVVEALRQRHPDRPVVLVSKDINMRVKARALGKETEYYFFFFNDTATTEIYTGMLQLPLDFWAKVGKKVESWQSGASTCYRISGAITQQLHINQFVYYEAPGENSLFARVIEIRDKTAVLETLKDYGHQKNNVWGVTTRNREQNFAMNLLMDPDVDFVTLAGTAGTGKTLMALAAGLNQVLDERRYTEIIMTRATVSVGEDIGFLPGTEEEKMGPWMGALDDNLEFLAKGDGGNPGEWGRSATNDLIRSRIKIKSMNFMRGRTFLNKYVIIDEAQNLTPKQMKTLITRAGPGTKIICMGNLAQIDTPYLTEGSSGLTYVVDRFKGWPHSGHITLARGERSRLADFASDVL
jgi:PhoH-like ATPase